GRSGSRSPSRRQSPTPCSRTPSPPSGASPPPSVPFTWRTSCSGCPRGPRSSEGSRVRGTGGCRATPFRVAPPAARFSPERDPSDTMRIAVTEPAPLVVDPADQSPPLRTDGGFSLVGWATTFVGVTVPLLGLAAAVVLLWGW